MTHPQRIRMRLIFLGIALAAGVLVVTLYSLELVHGADYAARAKAQYAKPKASLWSRGTIYFQSKDGTRVAAATVERGNLVYINPKQLSNPEQAYEAVSEFLKMDKSAFMKAAQKNDSYEELAHKVSDAAAQSVAALNIKGLSAAPESWRSYPGGILASQTLGLVGENESTSTISGRYGLEKSYESTLSRPEAQLSADIFAQLFSGVHDILSGNSEQGDIVTAIEPTVESYLEKVLSDASAVWHPDEIGGIVLDPATGEIAAMASIPTFNGNDTAAVSDPAVFSNPLAEHVYEMGSIMKPLTMAAGLDAGVITPSSTYDDTGTMVLDGRTIGNFDGKARGITGMQDILSQSLNMGAATVGLKLGGERMAKYFDAFGLGQKTGIDLPDEAKGLVGNLKTGQDIEIATASYGQGIAVSPVEMARALSVLANGGYLVIPHAVKEIDYLDGSKKRIAPAKTGPVLSAQTVHEVTGMLVAVVDKALKQGKIKMEHYSVAAKTGTAQIPDHQNGGYYKDKFLHSFFGYFPAYDPKFLIFLYQIHPKGAQFASETLTDPFDNLAKFLINYYDIPPDR